MGEDLIDDLGILDTRDDPHRPAAGGAGSGRDRILMATVYLTDLADYDSLCEGRRTGRSGWRIEVALTAAA